jgi:hypothetical protein
MTAFVHVAPTQGPGWSKAAAVRASETARVSELLNRLLADLAQLGSAHQPRLDYLDRDALDSVRGDPDTYNLIGRAASPLKGAGYCLTAAYWHDGEAEVDVELEVADDEVVWGPALAPVPAPPLSHRLNVKVDCREGRVERLEVGD